MFSIRNASLLLIAGVIVGCQTKSPEKPLPPDRPMRVDDATRLRNWDSTTAYYRNGAVESTPSRFRLESSRPKWAALTDTPVFVANVVLLPFTYIKQGPRDTVTNEPAQFNPSYTGGVGQNEPPK